jgi:pimeloyl-ACP methyl ester carboxylesterase
VIGSGSELVLASARLCGHGLSLASDVYGPQDGRPVLLFHGGGQTKRSWSATAKALAELGWRSYAIDLRGHGESNWARPGQYGVHAFSADVHAVATSMEELPVIVGASLGGMGAMVAIAEADEPIASGLVLVDVATRFEPSGSARGRAFLTAHLDGFADLDEVADAIRTYNPGRTRPTNHQGLRKVVRQRPDGRWIWHWDPAFLSGAPGSINYMVNGPDGQSISASAEPVGRAAHRLDLPILLVRGRESDFLSEDGVRQFLEVVPHAHYVDVASAGHMLAGDNNDVFNDAVVAFLATV